MGNFNIADNYTWTTTEGSYKKEAPRIYARSYVVDQNAISQAIGTYVDLTKRVIGGGGDSYYDGLHKTTDSDTWVFPYFGDEVRNFSSSWGDTYVGSTNGSQIGGAGFISDIQNAANISLATLGSADAIMSGKYGALFEPPKFYSYGVDDNALSVEFPLINTFKDSDYTTNYDLIKTLITQNKFKREGGFVTTPPRLWSVTVPGYRAIRWASCGVSVSLVGKRVLKDQMLIPEGYRVTLTFTSLYTEPSNFMSKVTQGSSL